MRTHWHWQKVFFLAAALAAAGAGGFLAVRTTGVATGDERLPPPAAPSAPGATEDEKAIRKNQSAYVKAFNAGDAKALAAFWTVDGEFVDATGHAIRGRAAIEKEFATFFAETKGRALAVSPGSLRFVSADVALESGKSRVSGADGPETSAAYHIVHSKRDGQWLMASVREAPYTAASNYEHLREIEWLVGNWTAKRGAQTLEMSCEWTTGRNFLLRKYSLKEPDGPTKTGMQIVGWDAVLGTVRSWVFDSDGGFGSDVWTKDGKRWVMEATGVTRDGAQTTATNVLTLVDHDSFNWQSVERTLNEVRLPDTTLIKVTRVKAKK